MTAPEPRWRTTLITWVAIYPTITLVGAATAPLTSAMPWAVRTLVLTTLMVPLVVYLVGPMTRAASAALGRATTTTRQRSLLQTRKELT